MCLGNGDICIIRYMKLMLDHYVSRFIRYIQRIGKKQTRLQFQHPNYVCFDAYKACMTLKYFCRGRPIEIACFPDGQLHSPTCRGTT